MDGLRIFARRDLDQLSKFLEDGALRHPSDRPLSLIRATRATDNETLYHVVSADEETIGRQVQMSGIESEKGCTAASLTLVVIPRETRGLVFISKAAFLRIFERFHIDPYVLRLLSLGSAGLHHDPNPYESCYTYYIGCFLYTLMWSFNPATMGTCAILLPRKNIWSKMSIDPVDDFGQVLEVYQRRLYTPVLLVFVTLVHLTRKLDDLIRFEASVIRQTEESTLHGPHGSSQNNVGIDQLSAFAGALEDSLGHLYDHSRHLEIAKSLAEFLEAKPLASTYHGIPRDMSGNYDEDVGIFGSALGVLRSQIEDSKSGVMLFRERARNQYSVIFALLTHQDARMNLSQAVASREVAEAAKEDASSMKTIAIMTMAFLPATFFAALFAVPSLKWDQVQIVQDNFWVYWAFAIPATVLVFGCWLLLTSWKPKRWPLHGSRIHGSNA